MGAQRVRVDFGRCENIFEGKSFDSITRKLPGLVKLTDCTLHLIWYDRRGFLYGTALNSLIFFLLW